MSSSCWLILVLTVASGTSVPLLRSNQETTEELSPNDVDSKIAGLKKFATTHLVETTNDEEVTKRDEAMGESNQEDLQVSTTKDEMYGKSLKKGRKHKAFFLNYPFVPQVKRYQKHSNHDTGSNNYNDPIQKRKPGHRKRFPDSEIYYIRLPPTPYMYVPGLGYISQPPTYSTAGLQRPAPTAISHVLQKPHRPQNDHHKPNVNSFINVPIDFVSNGKPTGVYEWQGSKRPDSSLNSLNEGPYVFNGRPASLYLLTEDGQQTGHQPIRLADYSNNGYY